VRYPQASQVAIISIAEKKPISNARAAILFFALARQINAVCAKITAAASQQQVSEQRLIGNKNAQNQNLKRAGFKIPSVMTGCRECARNINDQRQSKQPSLSLSLTPSYCFSSPTQAQRAIKVIRCHKITGCVSLGAQKNYP
jgi:hypothetical protein